ncbi:DUF4179 domain-containing protein [Lysinibacillus sp. 3P01SB]|uniref:DUF4179 domain-containing protein n=1 Tax=Lysinibacillus sp. 3P01SB TaxID=3132284 RepID=UPI0039A453B1
MTTPFDFEKLNKELDQINVPKEQLAKTRHRALQKVQKEKRRISNWRYYTVLTAAAALAFILSIRFIPPFAETMTLVPGFTEVVLFLTEDQRDEKYTYEELDISETKNNLTLTVKGVLADETGMKIRYSLEAPYNIAKLPVRSVTILQDGKELDGASSYGSPVDGEIKKYIEDTIFQTVEGENLPNKKNFELQITFGDKEETTFEIPFTIKSDIVKKQVYKIDQTFSYEGQKLIVKDITIAPTSTRLRITSDASNSMQILNVGHVRVFNEQGEPVNTPENGLTGLNNLSYGEVIYLFESDAVNSADSLTIELENIDVLPKDDNYVEVDFSKQIVLKQPAIGKVKFKIRQGGVITIEEEEGTEVRLSHAIDADGRRFEMESFSSTWNQVDYTYPIEMKAPVKIYFYNFPNTIYFKEQVIVNK